MTGGADPVLVDPLPNHRFDEARLVEWLSGPLPEAADGIRLQQFQGGMSNPTFLITTAPGSRYVLRKKPPGKLLPKAHAVDREYRVMRALGPTEVPVPEMVALCDDPDIIGAEFYVMRHIEGRVITDPLMGPVPRDDRPALAFAMIDTLARLHNVDWRAAGLEAFGRPENYLGRQVSRWSGQYEAGKSALPDDVDHSSMDRLRTWLEQNSDVTDESAIAHGDFRLGNLIIANDSPRVIAVLDWELSTIGHPIADLAYLCLSHRMAARFSPQGSADDTGIPEEAALIDRYCKRTGRDGIPGWPVFLGFACFRYAAIIQGVAARAVQGNASSSSVDPMAQVERARRVAELGLQAIAGASTTPA